MNLGEISINNETLHALMDKTDSKSPIEALDKAIRFTLLHDTDDIINELYELAMKNKKT